MRAITLLSLSDQTLWHYCLQFQARAVFRQLISPCTGRCLLSPLLVSAHRSRQLCAPDCPSRPVLFLPCASCISSAYQAAPSHRLHQPCPPGCFSLCCHPRPLHESHSYVASIIEKTRSTTDFCRCHQSHEPCSKAAFLSPTS